MPVLWLNLIQIKPLKYKIPVLNPDLKRLYDKAYKNRDFKTRQEDLLQKFLLGLQDYKARIHIELNKDPQTIEEAAHEVITYSETMKNPNPDENNKKTVRQVKKSFGQLNGKKTTDDSKPNPIPNSDNAEVTEQKSKTLTIKEDELKSLFDRMFELGIDSSDVKDDRSLVKINCSQEEEKSLAVTNEKSPIPESDEEVETSSEVKDKTPQSNKLDIIGRQVVRCDGVYLDGSIQ
ncbi:Hypothetical predicted protein [Mytilus galloprovincialis]|uniref:Uncharacterized protein n=1 Tax=Mytilus galloprovincialis TaxID=29158 RepID=A0A8B6DMU2_MYTGA|nr:Hypothetical predicted protein [Mytilus galloprovincialis]